jgi:ribonuclease HII
MSRRGPSRQAHFNWAGPALTAGVDEAGRGPLAGPVVAAAVILEPSRPVAGLADSKVLSPARREVLATTIRAQSLAWGLGWADAAEIDTLNILQATMLAMRRALAALTVPPQHVIIDGNRCPDLGGLAFDCTALSGVRPGGP